MADRNWRAGLATALTSAALALIGVVLAGHALLFAFLDQLEKASYAHLLSPLVYSVGGILTAIWAWIGGAPAELVPDKTFSRLPIVAWISITTYALLVLGSAVILYSSRRLARGTALVVRLLAIWSLLAVCGPLGWAHYALGPVLLLPALFSVFEPRRAMIVIVAVVAGLSLPTSWIVIWLLPGVSLSAVAAILSMLTLAAVLAFAP